MTIAGTTETYTTLPDSVRVGQMLRAVDAGLADLSARVVEQTSSSILDIVKGLDVSLGTFPTVNVAAGGLLTPTKSLYSYEASEFEVDAIDPADATWRATVLR